MLVSRRGKHTPHSLRDLGYAPGASAPRWVEDGPVLECSDGALHVVLANLVCAQSLVSPFLSCTFQDQECYSPISVGQRKALSRSFSLLTDLNP
eukprot:4565737-Pyramimonas_sp.AAC.1